MTVTERRLVSASGSGVSSVNGELAQLLSSCSLGDEASFVELYDATVARLFGLVLRVKGHENLPRGGRETCPAAVTRTAR